jgi:hypothetical protein
MAILPEEGPAQVGPVRLPPGRWQYAADDGQLVAWVTVDQMPDAGRAWFDLAAARSVTGLVPVLLQEDPPDRRVGGAAPYFGFFHPADVALLDRMSAGDVLAAAWDRWIESSAPVPDTAPFGRHFPGLAPAETTDLPAAVLHEAAAALPAAHLGLVAARRPADVPATVGWSVFGVDDFGPAARALEIGAVLRSWESRFGARLLRIGADAVLVVLVERPPRTLELARRVAAEHCAFADEVDGKASYTVESVAVSLVGSPIWTFWWD